MNRNPNKSVSRRRFLKTAGVTALAASAGPAVIIPGRAQPRTLKILNARSTGSAYGKWFSDYDRAWGERNNIQVINDTVGPYDLLSHAEAEIENQRGHDIIGFWLPQATFEDHAIDHREIYQECERRYGKADDTAIRSTYNPKTDKFFAFARGLFATLLNYRKDLWDLVGGAPDTWEDIWQGGRRIKLLHERPVGFALTPQDMESEVHLRALLYSFGGSVQDADGRVVLQSKGTLGALKFFKSFFEQTMSQDMLTWNFVSNNHAMLASELSATLNPGTLVRTGENKGIPEHKNIWLAPPPQGPAGRFAPPMPVLNYQIWKFSGNIEGAKQYLVDLTGILREVFLRSEYNSYPSFPNTVPDLAQLVADDENASPRNKYQIIADAPNWTTNLGYPGYANPAVDETRKRGLITSMFVNVATGKMAPDEALSQADQEVKKIYDKWRSLGKI